MTKFTKKSGFTLIETLIYSMIFIIVVGGMMLFAIAMLTTSQRADSQVEVADNARFVIQKVQRALQGASAITAPTVGTVANSITITSASTSANPVIFDVSGGVMRIQMAGGIPIPLTNSSVTVSSLSFQNYSFSVNTKNTIRMRAKIDSVDPFRPASSSIDIFISVQ